MNSEDEIKRAFERVTFAGEPPMASTAADDLSRGRRQLRRRRALSWTTGVAGLAVVATGVAVALPGDSGTTASLEVAGGMPAPASTAEPSRSGSAGAGESDPVPGSDSEFPFPATRQLLLDTAAEHFDPERVHLPQESTNVQSAGGLGGAVRVGSKLDWQVPGESGLGLVKVAVTTPGFASSAEYARTEIAHEVGCDLESSSCVERSVPGVEGKVWVAEADPATHLQFGVVHERADGSTVSVGVYRLFGNNSVEPVSSVGITVDEAIAFVTDADLEVDTSELADADEPAVGTAPSAESQ